MKSSNKKAQFGLSNLSSVIITFVIIAVVAVLGLQLLGDQKADLLTDTAGCNSTSVSSCGAGYNASVDAITGVSKFPAKLPMIAGVLVLVIIIGILVAAFRFRT